LVAKMPNLNNKLSITIFFPFLNDWATVGSLILSAIATLKPLTDDYEVLIIDDGSNEQAKDMLKLTEKQLPNVRIITHEKNRGYGGALKSGFSAASKDYIFYTDCDAQYDVRELKLLIEKLGPNVDVVQGYKIKRNDPWYRVIIGKTYHFLVSKAFGLKIRDVDCDFRLIKRTVFDKVKLYENSGVICIELMKKIESSGFKIVEVPVHHFYRTSGKSQFFNIRRLLSVGKNLVKLWWKLIIKKQPG